MFVCTTVLYEYMNSLKNDGNNLFGNTPVLIKIYQEFYHSTKCIANEGRHIRICNIYVFSTKIKYCFKQRFLFKLKVGAVMVMIVW
jgi:hypothetical protein